MFEDPVFTIDKKLIKKSAYFWTLVHTIVYGQFSFSLEKMICNTFTATYDKALLDWQNIAVVGHFIGRYYTLQEKKGLYLMKSFPYSSLLLGHVQEDKK